MTRQTMKLQALLLAGITLSAVPAHAGFYMEGLEPYVIRYCDGADPAVTDPKLPPASDVYDHTSPDATWLEGRPGHISPNCTGKGQHVAPKSKGSRSSAGTYKVPQK